MRRRGKSFSGLKISLLALVLAGWLAAYIGLPYLSSADGPFDAPPFGFDVTGLPFMSQTELQLFRRTVFVLEARENQGPAPGTVFVLKDLNGNIRWTRVGAPELGRIQLEDHSASWFTPGGWVVRMKPEYVGFGEIYISPLGNFRFFFHKW